MHRPARTIVLPEPLSRMLAAYAAAPRSRSETSAPQTSYRLRTRPSAVGREIKRRSDVVGISSNDAAVIRPTGALVLEAGDERAVTRRRMSLEASARGAQTDPARLPTTAA